MTEQPEHQHTKRDAESLIMLGAFMGLLALPVIFGTIYATTPHARIVNLVSGVVLLAIGVGFIVRGFRKTRQKR